MKLVQKQVQERISIIPKYIARVVDRLQSKRPRSLTVSQYDYVKRYVCFLFISYFLRHASKQLVQLYL